LSRPPVCYGIDDYTNTANVLNNVAYQVDRIEEPTTIENVQHSKEWKAAADLEYSALMDNQTWELPEGKNVFVCKWVFRIKYDGKGEVNHFKGRLVAQGFSQIYEEVFSSVADLSSIHALLAFAAGNKLQVYQMGVISAFLNGDLKEDIYT